ncbi:helix-turn-helix transcriptional regulator [Saccharothrix deserti]|uniref:helix-turn-helix transcriptional regulator n=1 Tax=Saccharothrix deserti TaxID=2593674 RepID=UPI00131B317F|nr:LuxR family transcriptional regulator [Saccharothrix deserti]
MRPLIGREPVLARLDTGLRMTAVGKGSCFVAEGPAGIGKSGVLEATTAQARATGIGVLAGRATELDHRVPLASLRSVLRPLLSQAFADVESERNALRLVDRVGDLIEASAAQRPLLIVLDDAQWSDELSALALRMLIPAMASAPVMWLLARRPAPARGYAQDTVEWLLDEGAHRLPLGPLDLDAVRTLCEQVLGVPPDQTVLELAERCNGNPFLLDHLLTTLRDSGQLVVDHGGVRLLGKQLNGGFLSAVAHRLRDLSDTTKRVLDAGAVLGRPFTVHEVAGLVGRAPVELLPAIGEAIDAAILVDGGRTLSFRHDLIREALYGRLSGPVRLALHREAVQVVRTEGGSSGEVLEHVMRSGCRTDLETITLVRQSVHEMAPNTEADLVLRMLDLLDSGDPGRPRLIADGVWLLTLAGRATEAIELGERALATGLDPESEVDVLLRLAMALEITGRTGRTGGYTAQALARVSGNSPARAELLATHAHALLGVGDAVSADAAAADAVLIGSRESDHAAVAGAAAARSGAARMRGDLTGALAHATEAVAVAARADGPRVHLPRLWLAAAHAALDDFAATEAELAHAQISVDGHGAWWARPLWHRERAELRFAEGRLDAAAAEAETGVLVSEQLNAHPLGLPLLALLARIAIRRDDLVLTRNYLRRAEEVCADSSPTPEYLPWAWAALDEATGQHAVALSRLEPLLDRLPDRVMLFSREPAAAPRLVRLALITGASETAELVVESIRAFGERNRGAVSLGAASLHAKGLLRRDAGVLREAVARYRTGPRPLDLADALTDLGVAEEFAGRRVAAVEALDEAVGLFGECGAKRSANRAQQLLRELGVRKRIRQDNGAGWSSLTQSELRVVRLVAQGLTNREVALKLFLSPHTVDSHLRHSFVKLGITSRVELTRLVLVHDIGPESAVS